MASHALCAITCTCWVSTTPVVFSPYNPLSASNDDSVGHAKVGCGGIVGLLIPYQIALSAGGGTLANRQMASGAKKLPYNLYSSAAYTSIWGDGTGGTVTVGGSIPLDLLGLSPDIDHPIYGRVPARQTGVTPGSYTDTLTVTVTYY